MGKTFDGTFNFSGYEWVKIDWDWEHGDGKVSHFSSSEVFPLGASTDQNLLLRFDANNVSGSQVQSVLPGYYGRS